ncbi:MAG: 1-acyl-sn-glycerol-3-phosphate acyltransferase [Actinobacteria bacterium]|nr:1-acyl-sn-glycerol-3-phosphate acyltransferase [Actinomycetota bacterium]
MTDRVYPGVILVVRLLWKYLGLRFIIKGEENIPRSGGAILAINHVGYLDFAISGTAALPAKRYVRYMAKKQIFDNKIAGPLMRGMHHISVDRNSGSASFVAALRALKAGEIVGIFPEATISKSFEIKSMKSGAARLAIGANVPVIPTIVWGSQRIWTKGRKRDFRRNKFPISIYVGEPLVFTRETEVESAERQIKSALEKLLRKVQDEYPDEHRGQWWAPARLGGSAPTLEEVEGERG